jgi:N utilization substance protein A
VQAVVDELRGEKVDIVRWSDDPARYVASALSPAKVSKVVIDERTRSATVIAPDNQLSLAIGREGQNVRLAARLTGWRIDIRSEAQVAEQAAAVQAAAAAALVAQQPAEELPIESESVEPESVEPVEPESAEPVEPESVEPVEPQLVEPVEPQPVEPVEPESVEPVEPAEEIAHPPVPSASEVDVTEDALLSASEG